jgi:hypothetical protein
MIHLTQTRMKIHHASSIRLIKNKLFTNEIIDELTQKRLGYIHFFISFAKISE